MEDKLARFNKKVEPFSTDTNEKTNVSTYKSLISKIQNKVSHKGSVVKERPPKKDIDAKLSCSKISSATSKPLTKFTLTESKLNTINKSIISRVSQQRANPQKDNATSRPKSRANESASRDRSTLKERINRLSTLERNLKELDLKGNLLTTKKIGKPIPPPNKGGLSLLQKFQIYQLKNQGSDKSKSSKERSHSNGKSNALMVQTESPNKKFNEGLELLKKRIAQLPGKTGADLRPKDVGIIQSKSKYLVEGTPEAQTIKTIETSAININLYKKKVDPLAYKREDQSSLKILKARRSPNTFDSKRTNTIAYHSKLRIKDREATLN